MYGIDYFYCMEVQQFIETCSYLKEYKVHMNCSEGEIHYYPTFL
jgi:hypothetical protein